MDRDRVVYPLDPVLLERSGFSFEGIGFRIQSEQCIVQDSG